MGKLHAVARLHEVLRAVYIDCVAHCIRDRIPAERVAVNGYFDGSGKPRLAVSEHRRLGAVVAVRHRAHAHHYVALSHFLQRHRSVESRPISVVDFVFVIFRVGDVVPA